MPIFPSVTPLLEAPHTGNFILSLDDDGNLSRDIITLAAGSAGQLLKAGMVLGKRSGGVASFATKLSGANTGSGYPYLDPTTPVLAPAKPGLYTVRMTSATAYQVFDPVGGEIGTGTAAALASDTLTFGANATTGQIITLGNGTTTTVLTMRTAGTANAALNEINIGATAALSITAIAAFINSNPNADANIALFQATATSATVLTLQARQTGTGPNAYTVSSNITSITVASATLTGGAATTAFNDQIKFSVGTGTVAFVAGDGFDITVNPGSNLWVPSPKVGSVSDGSDIAAGVLYAQTDISAQTKATGVVRHCEVNSIGLIYDASVTLAADIAEKIAQLNALPSFVVRTGY